MAHTGYERHRERMAAAQKGASRAGRDIAPIPAVANPLRKITCCQNLTRFCEIYFAQKFELAWSPDHRILLADIENRVLHGGLKCIAMPRGSGKTTICEVAAIWAIVTGHRRFVVLIGSDQTAAELMLDSIKTMMQASTLLTADFPEVVYPITKLDGIAQRAGGQLCSGKPTAIGWGQDMIILPTIAGSRASGTILVARGLATSGLRGLKHDLLNGDTIRPDFALIDDPQTNKSARSPGQVTSREEIVNGAVLGLAGPDKSIAAIMPCTVIAADDLADRTLDQIRSPAWKGQRCKLLYARKNWPGTEGLKPEQLLPEHTKLESLWDQYAKIRADSLRAGGGGKEATDFYVANREQMDAGATPGWPVRYIKASEVSAIQHAMNLMLDRGKEAFNAEFQNEPLQTEAEKTALTPAQVMSKANGLPRGIVPKWATRLVEFIDVQQELLYFGILAVDDEFTGHIVDYGTYPDQRRQNFAKSNVKRTLMIVEKASREEESLIKGLNSLASLTLARDFKREDGGDMRVERCNVDARWGKHTDLVKEFCRTSAHAGVLTASFGMFVGAGSLPITEAHKRKKGDRIGKDYVMPAPKPGQARHVRFDSNSYKSYAHSRFSQSPGGLGNFSLFGDPEDHQMFAEQVAASEYAVRTEGRGRSVEEWKVKPTRPDNEYLDIVAGLCVAAHIAGARLTENAVTPEPKREKKKLSDLQKVAKHHG